MVGPFGVAVGVAAGVGVGNAVAAGESVSAGVGVTDCVGVAVGTGVAVAASVGMSVASGIAGAAHAPSRINVKHIATITRNVRCCFIKHPAFLIVFAETKKEPKLLLLWHHFTVMSSYSLVPIPSACA